jgi:heme/copper-type cytochrome/quinol oxidase subunit 3
MGPRAAALRQLRTVHAIFVLVVFMQVYVSEVAARTGTGITPSFISIIGVLACFELMIANYFRSKRTIPAMEKLRLEPNDADALKQWRAGIILTLVLVMSVALYGVVLRSLGASRRFAWPFFVVALIFMLMWRPQLDLNGEILETRTPQ